MAKVFPIGYLDPGPEWGTRLSERGPPPLFQLLGNRYEWPLAAARIKRNVQGFLRHYLVPAAYRERRQMRELGRALGAALTSSIETRFEIVSLEDVLSKVTFDMNSIRLESDATIS